MEAKKLHNFGRGSCPKGRKKAPPPQDAESAQASIKVYFFGGADGFKSKASYARPVAGLKMSSRKSRERAYLPSADGFKSKALMLSCCRSENELPQKPGAGIPSGRRRHQRKASYARLVAGLKMSSRKSRE